MRDPVDLRDRFETPCRECGLPIMMVWINATDRLPVDVEPSPYGDVMITVAGRKLTGMIIGRRYRSRMKAGGWSLYVQHRGSCPRAERWTTRRTANPGPHETAAAYDGVLW